MDEATRRRLAKLSPAKRALLEAKLAKRKSASQRSPLPEGDRAEPCSGQKRVWLTRQRTPDSVEFNNHRAFRLWGALDLPALHAALDAVVRRHEALRTVVLRDAEGRLRQRVLEASPVPIEHIDLVHLDPASRESAAEDIAADRVSRPFDIERGPILQFSLLSMAPEEHVLLLSVDHMAFDGWSTGIFVRELGQAYAARRAGTSADAEPTRYSDYTVWQNAQLAAPENAALRRYWRDRLTSADPTLHITTDFVRPEAVDTRGRRVTRRLPKRLHDALGRYARAQAASLFHVLLAGFADLLRRHTGQSELVIGTPVAGRRRVEFEAMIGFFVNTLPLRLDLGGAQDFARLLRHVREVSLEAIEHQDLPFEQILEVANPPREPSRPLLFEVAFQLKNYDNAPVEQAGLRIEPFEYDFGIARSTLHLMMKPHPAGLDAVLEYNADLFREESVERLLAQLQQVYEHVALDSGPGPAALMQAGERAHLDQLCRADVAFDERTPVVARIRAQAELRPEAVAVQTEEGSLSYRGLLEGGRAVAAAAAFAPGARVVVIAQRGLRFSCALVGILESGAVYVPLDVKEPDNRVMDVLRSVRPAVLIVDDPDRARRLDAPCPVVELGAVNLDRTHPEAPAHDAAPEALAYIMHTSGSTGRPKATGVTHANLAHFVGAVAHRYGLRSGARGLQLSSLAFDISIEDILPLWCTGATVLMHRNPPFSEVTRFSAWLDEYAVSFMSIPTSLFHAWVEQLEAAGAPTPAGLQTLVLGGEALSPEACRGWRRRGGRTRLINTYGPTETTVTATAFDLPMSADEIPEPLPIGRPFGGIRTYVLDAVGRPVPVGMPGELYIGGAGVGAGYVDDPEQTARRFSADPLGGGRMYRTGDRCRWSTGGQLEFLGRVDRQHKIRGFRVELGEVEAVLQRHPRVQRAAASVVQDKGRKTLVAHVGGAGEAPDQAETLEWCKANLPAHMVPVAIQVQPELPLTPGGKVDRRRLEPVDLRGDRGRGDGARAQARDEVERKLLGIWSEVLARSEIGVEDDFFELGGHSLLTLELFVRVEKVFALTLPLTVIFEAPTVRQMAAQIRRRQSDKVNGDTPARFVELQRGGDRPPLIMVPGAGGHPIAFKRLIEHLAPEQPLWGAHLLGKDPDGVPYEDVPEIAAALVHDLRARCPEGPVSVGGYSAGGVIAFELARQLSEAGRRVERLILWDTVVPTAVGKKSRVRRWQQHLRLLRERRMAHVTTILRDKTGGLAGLRAASEQTTLERELVEHEEIVKRRVAEYTPGQLDLVVELFSAQPSDWGLMLDIPYDRGWGSVPGVDLRIHPLDAPHWEVFEVEYIPQWIAQLNQILGA